MYNVSTILAVSAFKAVKGQVMVQATGSHGGLYAPGVRRLLRALGKLIKHLSLTGREQALVMSRATMIATYRMLEVASST